MPVFGKTKGKGKTPVAGASGVGVSASSPSAGTGGGTAIALQNISTTLDILRSVGDASGILGPMKAVCGVLKVVVDTGVVSSIL
jgi:hypothetical protein